MAQAGQRKCLSCNIYFTPDRRVGKRQRYCSTDACQKVSKARSQQRWLDQPANRDYFHGPVHVARVQVWRTAHPDYVRRPAAARSLRDECPPQSIDKSQESVNRTLPPEALAEPPLQDLINASSPILAGLIAHLFELRLQDEMAATARRLVQLGTDILGGRHGQTQAGPAAAAPAARAATVQLD
jgi:hypothetical protein